MIYYKIKIKNEGNAFLYKCKQAYEKLYNKESLLIKCSSEAFEMHSSNFEADFEVAWEKAFKY